MNNDVVTTTATIANGGTTSDLIDLRYKTVCGLKFPSSLTSTSMTFTVSDTATGTFATMADGAGSDISKTIAAGKYIPLSPNDFAGVRFLKLVAGSSEGAARSIGVCARMIG